MLPFNGPDETAPFKPQTSNLKQQMKIDFDKEEIAHHVGPSQIDIAYQQFGDSSNPPVFLIMGGGAQMIHWPDSFCESLVRHGLQIIRFDNRDTGHSTHITDAPVPDLAAAMKGDYSTASYSLSDMASDTVGLMDFLGFDRVHLVGASMGGMIAQTIAIEYPGRVCSLTSIMSTTGNPAVGQTDFASLAHIGMPPQDDRQGFIEWSVRSLNAIGSTQYPLDEEAAADRAGRAWDRDHDPLGMLRQSVAVLKSGDRTELLKKLRVPALVIHGSTDKMLHVSGGKATAQAIPGAKLQIIEEMGHGFPPALLDVFAHQIAQHVKNAEAT